jgi:uncharacterized membrane protein YdjX (TVP38/TMEM64 family)
MRRPIVNETKPSRLPTTSRPRAIVVIFLVLATAAVTLAYAFEVSVPEWPEAFTTRGIEETVLSWGAWGVVASIGLMVVHSFVPFPAEFVAVANGMAYGALWGTVVTWSGAMLGAFLAFGLTRWLGRPLVRRAMTGTEWAELDDWLARKGGSAIFISRFIPIISFNLVNYAAGLAPISWRTFAWTTGIGILPLTTLMVVLGDQSHHMGWSVWLILLGAGLALWPPMHWALRRARHPSRTP